MHAGNGSRAFRWIIGFSCAIIAVTVFAICHRSLEDPATSEGSRQDRFNPGDGVKLRTQALNTGCEVFIQAAYGSN